MTDTPSAAAAAAPAEEDAQPLMPAEGSAAPDFELPDDHGTRHHLADARGKWVVLYFYPEDDTPGCTTEACEFRDADAEIRWEGATVWGVSPQGPESKARFREKYSLPFPLLADEDHAVADRYGTWVLKNLYGRRYWGVQRATFLVDPEGRIARALPRVKAAGHAAQVLEALREAKGAGGAVDAPAH